MNVAVTMEDVVSCVPIHRETMSALVMLATN